MRETEDAMEEIVVKQVKKRVKQKPEKTLEMAFEEMNLIIAHLEAEDISLEDSFRLYKEGMELLKYCNQSIDRVEKQLLILEEGEDDGIEIERSIEEKSKGL